MFNSSQPCGIIVRLTWIVSQFDMNLLPIYRKGTRNRYILTTLISVARYVISFCVIDESSNQINFVKKANKRQQNTTSLISSRTCHGFWVFFFFFIEFVYLFVYVPFLMLMLGNNNKEAKRKKKQTREKSPSFFNSPAGPGGPGGPSIIPVGNWSPLNVVVKPLSPLSPWSPYGNYFLCMQTETENFNIKCINQFIFAKSFTNGLTFVHSYRAQLLAFN